MKLDAVQSAFFAKMAADADLVGALSQGWGVPAVFNHVPQVDNPESDSLFPYVSFGAGVGVPYDTKTDFGAQASIQVDAWSRQRGELEVREISQRIWALLHHQPLTISGASHVMTLCDSITISTDPDGVTRRALMLFTVIYDAV
jgi:hypothetical protein